jgi:superfamily II DNA or RNA helicase
MNLRIDSNILLKCDDKEIVSKIISENTFENPKYLSNEKNRKCNWNTDRFISTCRYQEGSLVLPRGYMKRLKEIIQEHNITVEVEDLRSTQPTEYPALKATLRPYQVSAVEEAMKSDEGVIVSPTGSGKSLIGIEIIRKRGQKALIIVHRLELAKQWASVIEERLGLKAGVIGDGEWSVDEQITIAMIQTLASRDEEMKALSNVFGLILLDEGHHAPASTFYDVIGLLNAKYRYSVSATPSRRDGLEKMIYLCVGPILSNIDKQEVEGMGSTVPVTVYSMKTGFKPPLLNSWSEYLDSLTVNTERNMRIIDLVQQSDAPTLVLVDRIAHAEQLSDMLTRRDVSHVVAHGKLSKSNREIVMDKIKSSRVTVGTTALLGEGLDISAWSILIMAAPISSEIKLMQAIGRIVRPAHGKERAFVYDLKDDCGFAGGSFNKRLEIYKKHKIWVEFRK